MAREIRLTGSGGQGLILAGIILADTAIMQGDNAIQSQSYGPEARGGASKAEVIISKDEIYYPKVGQADVMLSLTQVALDKYYKTVKKEGILVVDASLEIPADIEVAEVIAIPIMETAAEKVGKIMVANIVALGAMNGKCELVDNELLVDAVLARVPRGTEELNKKALQEGYNLVK